MFTATLKGLGHENEFKSFDKYELDSPLINRCHFNHGEGENISEK
jgi:hypothetical protein